MAVRVLFLSRFDSATGQMAEGSLRELVGAAVDVHSPSQSASRRPSTVAGGSRRDGRSTEMARQDRTVTRDELVGSGRAPDANG